MVSGPTKQVFFALILLCSPALISAVSPPASTYMTISKGSVIQTMLSGNDIWVNSWGADGNIYTAYGDGKGFSSPIKLSQGLAKLLGSPPSTITGADIRTSSFEETGDGATGKKASGMLMVDGTLYVWVRNANNNGQQCQLTWANSPYTSWTWSSWKFTEYGYCSFANYGQNYAGAGDNYVYAFFSNHPSAYTSTDQIMLARVDKTQIKTQSAYQFFSGSSSAPAWGGTTRQPVLTHTGGVNRQDVTYDAAVSRYLMTMRSRSNTNHFSIYEAPNPWGPWSTAFYEPNAGTGNLGWGESQHIPSKWLQPLSANKQDFYLIHSGNDQFNLQKMTITLGSTPANTPTKTPTPIKSPTKTPTPIKSPTKTPTPIKSPTKTPTPGTSKPGDANGDNLVNGLDYLIWLSHYGEFVSGPANGDFNNSGKVDGADYLIWLSNYGL